MTVRLRDVEAVAHPDGYRIDLRWTNPDPAPAVLVVRRTGSHPESPTDGVVVATVPSSAGPASVPDVGLPGERVQYYALFPFDGAAPTGRPDPAHLVSGTPIEPYGFAARMYDLLPALHRRYDAGREPLRRFLEIPGGELDRLHSLASTVLDVVDPALVDGRLLPLLADWIGWPTDHTLSVAAQRAELRAAPWRYRAVGTRRALDTTVARVANRRCDSVELVHAVARTNQPERLNLWSRTRHGTAWSAGALASINQAVDGRAAAVPDTTTAGTPATRVFFHTRRPRGSEIWTKVFADGAWGASEPVVAGDGEARHPAAAVQGARRWLFWQGRDPGDPGADVGRLWSSTRTGADWSPPAVLFPGVAATRPAAVADGTGVWLFWLDGGAIRFRRHDGTAWSDPVRTVPTPSGSVPVHDDLFVVVRSSAPRLWVLWAGRAPGQNGWSVGWVTKQGLDPAAADWSPPAALPQPAGAAVHDRQPAALATAAGLDLYWSTTRHGGWSIDQATVSGSPPTATGLTTLVPGPFPQRAPLPVALPGGDVLLVSRSTEGGPDHRGVGTTTVDTRARAKLALRGTARDFQTYVPGGRVTRDGLGVFLGPAAGESPERVAELSARLTDALAEVLPPTCRPVVIT